MAIAYRSVLAGGGIKVDSLTITTMPTKTSYVEGDTLDTTGLVVTATAGLLSGDVTSECSISPTTLSNTGTQTITVSYGGQTATFNVTVAALTLAITTAPTKTEYVVGENLDLTGIVVTATANGTSTDVTSQCTFSPANGSAITSSGNITVTATYKGKTATTTVISYAVSAISITTQPTKTAYIVGDTLDLTGIVVTATAGSLTRDVTSSCTFSPTNGSTLSTAGSTTITATFGSLTATTTVTAYAYSAIEITTPPTKTSYKPDEQLDLTGIVVTGTAGTLTRDVTSQCTFNPANGTTLSTEGTFSITATFNGLTDTVSYTVKGSNTYTVRLNLSQSDPSQWGEYQDDAVGMTAGSDDFDTFFGHYPCILDNGTELGKLKRDDYTKYEDGTSAPITTLGKDVMVYFPRRGLKIWKDSGYLYVSITDEKGKDGYDYDAFTYKGNACDGFYRGAYKAYNSGSKLYSVSGQTPTTSVTIGNFRTYARARGTGYEQSAFYQLTYLQAMYLIKYRGQNAQIAVGRGFVDGNSAIYGATGYTNNRGMDWGESTGKYPMKLFGMEDFYGNIFEFIDGLYSNSNRQLYASDGNYNDTGSNYTSLNTASFGSNISNYMKDVNGNTHAGFTPSSQSYGSATTYFCDYAYVSAGRLATFGGNWIDADAAGVFRLYVDRSASDAYATSGARLMYFKQSA